MGSVDSHAVWSLLDAKGTQMMMKGMLGEASQIADYDTVKNRMGASHYGMDFQNGVKFDLGVNMSDTMTAATCSTLLKGVQMLKKAQGTPLEKTALDDTEINSTGGIADGGLLVHRQPVSATADVAAVSVSGEVTEANRGEGSGRGERASAVFVCGVGRAYRYRVTSGPGGLFAAICRYGLAVVSLKFVAVCVGPSALGTYAGT